LVRRQSLTSAFNLFLFGGTPRSSAWSPWVLFGKSPGLFFAGPNRHGVFAPRLPVHDSGAAHRCWSPAHDSHCCLSGAATTRPPKRGSSWAHSASWGPFGTPTRPGESKMCLLTSHWKWCVVSFCFYHGANKIKHGALSARPSVSLRKEKDPQLARPHKTSDIHRAAPTHTADITVGCACGRCRSQKEVRLLQGGLRADVS